MRAASFTMSVTERASVHDKPTAAFVLQQRPCHAAPAIQKAFTDPTLTKLVDVADTALQKAVSSHPPLHPHIP